MNKLSIIIPAHNEEAIIGKTLAAFNAVKAPHEIIVVADHCTDGTERIAKEFIANHSEVRLVTNPRRGSFGNALRAGFAEATGDAVVPIMADLCDDPLVVDRMYAKLQEGYDVVCGSRYMRGGKKIGGPKIQGIISNIVSASLHIISRIPTWDVANSLKMYRRDFLENIGYDIPNAGTEFSMRLAYRAYFFRGRITEIPTTWIGESIPFSQEFKIFKRTPGYLKAYISAVYKQFLGEPNNLHAVVFLGLVSLLVFSPVLFDGMIFSEGERVSGYYPWALFYGQSIHSGHSILWNPYYFGGFPTFLNQFIGSLYPLHYILFFLFPAIAAFHISILLAFFGGVTFAYLFGRLSGLSIPASIILSLTYTIGQTFTLFSTGISYTESFFVLPILLYALLSSSQAENSKRYILGVALLGVAIGIGFLAGFAQTFLYALIFSGCYAIFLDLKNGFRMQIRAWRASAAMALGACVGIILGLPQLLAVLSFIPYSVRTLDYTTNEGFLHVFNLATFLVPYYIRIPHLMSGTAGIYFGTFAFILFLYAVFFSRAKEVLFFALSYAVMLLFALHVPLFSLVNDHGPFLSRLGTVTRWLLIGAFPFAAVCAYGFDHICVAPSELLSSRKFTRFIRVITTVIYLMVLGLLSLSSALFVLARNESLQQKLLGILLHGRQLSLSSEHYRDVFVQNIREVYRPISFNSFSYLLFIGIAIIAPVIILRFRKTGDRAFFAFGAISLLLLNALLCLLVESDGAFISKKVFLETPPVAQTILSREKNLNSFRVLPFLVPEALFREVYAKRGLTQNESALVNRDFLMSDIGTYYGIQNMYGFEPLRSLRQNQLFDTLIDPNESFVFNADAVSTGARIDQHVNNQALTQVSIPEKISSFITQQNLISMLNVKYVISYYPLSASNLKSIPIGSTTLGVPEYLYQNTSVMPRIYLANSVISWKKDDRNLLAELSKPHDFSKETFIECKDCANTTATGSAQLKVLSYENGKVVLQVDSQNGQWLVLSDANLPGWRATIDSTVTHIYTANYLFQAIHVPEGFHTVKFEYHNSWKEYLLSL